MYGFKIFSALDVVSKREDQLLKDFRETVNGEGRSATIVAQVWRLNPHSTSAFHWESNYVMGMASVLMHAAGFTLHTGQDMSMICQWCMLELMYSTDMLWMWSGKRLE